MKVSGEEAAWSSSMLHRRRVFDGTWRMNNSLVYSRKSLVISKSTRSGGATTTVPP